MKQKLDRIHLIYEDADVVVIEKESGVITYPSGDVRDSAIQLIRRIWKARKSESKFLYLIHRLDMDTSGLLVFAKTSAARRSLHHQFERHEVIRGYTAVTLGIPRVRSGKIEGFLGREKNGRRGVTKQGRFASTKYEVIGENRSRNRALVRCRLLTGRTHQVRIHLAHLGIPVAGDRVYGRNFSDRLGLHAETLGFLHPRTGKPIVFRSSLPLELKRLFS